MKDTTVHELLLNGVLMAHYTIDRGLLFLKIRRTPDPLKSISDNEDILAAAIAKICLLYTSPSPRDRTRSRMPSSA